MWVVATLFLRTYVCRSPHCSLFSHTRPASSMLLAWPPRVFAFESSVSESGFINKKSVGESVALVLVLCRLELGQQQLCGLNGEGSHPFSYGSFLPSPWSTCSRTHPGWPEPSRMIRMGQGPLWKLHCSPEKTKAPSMHLPERATSLLLQRPGTLPE